MNQDLIKHFNALRFVLIRISVYIVITSVFLYCYYGDFIISFLLGKSFQHVSQYTLTYNSLFEAFNLKLYVSIVGAVYCVFVPIILEIIMFLWGGLHYSEKKFTIVSAVLFVILFYCGGVVAIWYFVPFVVEFFVPFTIQNVGSVLLLNISDFIDFVVLSCIAFSVVLNYPTIIYALAHVGVVNTEMLVKFRKYNIILSFIIGAVVTPPDVLSQSIVAVALIILFEIGVILSYKRH